MRLVMHTHHLVLPVRRAQAELKRMAVAADQLLECWPSFRCAGDCHLDREWEENRQWNVRIPGWYRLPSRIFCVTVNVLPVSSGTVQLTGSGERISNCSGDLTLVGSGGDLIIGSSIASGIICCVPFPLSKSVPSAASSAEEREDNKSGLLIYRVKLFRTRLGKPHASTRTVTKIIE